MMAGFVSIMLINFVTRNSLLISLNSKLFWDLANCTGLNLFFVVGEVIEGEQKFTIYKIPGGKRIKLIDKEAVLAFDSYYPDWDKKFYTVPSCLKERDSFFGLDRGYEGEIKVADAFKQSQINGILIANFSDKDKNNILQSKSKAKFECDFILLTKEYGMLIVELCHSAVGRIQTSIKEKFEQLKKNRNHIMSLCMELFGHDFSKDLEKLYNGVIAIPNGTTEDFNKFKEAKTWSDFINSKPNYTVTFLGKENILLPSSISKCLMKNPKVCPTDPLVSTLPQFYATITLVKTSFQTFHLENALSNAEKKEIQKVIRGTDVTECQIKDAVSKAEKREVQNVTGGVHVSKCQIILSPEQQAILNELHTHLTIFGEAATGKTELLKAALLIILKCYSPIIKQDSFQSKQVEFAKGIKLILFFILGNKPYLNKSMDSFISHIQRTLKLSPDSGPRVELRMVLKDSIQEIETEVKTFLYNQTSLKSTFVFIDESYTNGIVEQMYAKAALCKGCWIAGVLAGQNPLSFALVTSRQNWKFKRHILRRSFRGTENITKASSNLRLFSPNDRPVFLANQFSYIKSYNDIKFHNVLDIDQSSKSESAFIGVIREKDVNHKYSNYVDEEISLENLNAGGYLPYQIRCGGYEWTSVTIILALTSCSKFFKKKDIIVQLFCLFISRAISNCTIICGRELQERLKKVLVPGKVMSLIQSGNCSELKAIPFEDIIHSFDPTGTSWIPLSVATATRQIEVVKYLLAKLNFDQRFLFSLFLSLTREFFQEKAVDDLLLTLCKKMKQEDQKQVLCILCTASCQTENHFQIFRFLKDSVSSMMNYDSLNKTLTSTIVGDHYGCLRMLLEESGNLSTRFDVNYWTKEGECTPLHLAVRFVVSVLPGSCLEILLNKGADVNMRDEEGHTPLMVASRDGQAACLPLLLCSVPEWKISHLNEKNNEGSTALMLATLHREIKCIYVLLVNGADVEIEDDRGENALMIAAQVGYIDGLQILLNAGAKINSKSHVRGHTALMQAAQWEETECLRILLKSGADIDLKSNKLVTALMYAAMYGNVECVKVLVSHGADVNARSISHSNALMHAAAAGHSNCIQPLLSGGSEINGKDSDGLTALMEAARRGRTECLRILLANGADVNLKSNSSLTALVYAAICRNTGCAELLINQGNALNHAAAAGLINFIMLLLRGTGSKINAKDTNGITALMKAAHLGQTEYLQILLTNGANVNLKSNSSLTALMYAAMGGNAGCVEILLNKGADINMKDEEGHTPLMVALKDERATCLPLLLSSVPEWTIRYLNEQNSEGVTALMLATLHREIKCIYVLLINGADVEIKDDRGETVLMIAAQEGYTDGLQILLNAGAEVNNVSNKNGHTALMQAAQCGETGCLRILLRSGADINLRCNLSLTALMYAAMEGNAGCVELLLNQGADVNARSISDINVLMFAAEAGHSNCIHLLLSRGSEINAKDECGRTALIEAAHHGQTDCLRILLTNGANVNLKSNSSLTALMYAAMEGNAGCVELLLNQGADVNARSISYSNALMLAAKAGHSNCIHLLLSHGSEINAKDDCGETALMEAAHRGQTDCLRILLTNGANVNLKSNSSLTALMYAAMEGNAGCVELLLNQGADVNARSISYSNALMLAAKVGHSNCIHLLLSHGSEINAKDDCGKTALMEAAYRGQTECLRILLTNGANVSLKSNLSLTALMYAALGENYKCFELLST